MITGDDALPKLVEPVARAMERLGTPEAHTHARRLRYRVGSLLAPPDLSTEDRAAWDETIQFLATHQQELGYEGAIEVAHIIKEALRQKA